MGILARRGTKTRVDRFRVQQVGLDGDVMVTLFITVVWERYRGFKTGKQNRGI